MLERRYLGEFPSKPHTLFEKDGKRYTEWVITRDGFQGGFSLLYQTEAPTALGAPESFSVDQAFFGSFQEEESLSRRHFQSQNLIKGQSWSTSRRMLMKSEHCRVSTLVGKMDGPAFCNAEADELYFIRQGEGFLLTPFGKLAFSPGDYLLIPRGILWKMTTGAEGLDALLVEGAPELAIPKDFLNPHGQLKLEAPYTHRDFRSPEDLLSEEEADSFQEVVVLRKNQLTKHTYRSSPAKTIGWDGSVYPIAFNISLYQPKTGKIHLPPNLHLTFQGTGFVICSFVPRQVDYMEGAIPCPYPHANVACDEVLYYVSGDFTSRKGVAPGSLSYHPYGVAHGPQPGQYFASIGQKRTEEMAVMIDTWEPLSVAQQASDIEDPHYPTSWT